MRAEQLIDKLLNEMSSTYPPKRLIKLASDYNGRYDSTHTGYRDRNEPDHVFKFENESAATAFISVVKSKSDAGIRWAAGKPELRYGMYYVSVVEWH